MTNVLFEIALGWPTRAAGRQFSICHSAFIIHSARNLSAGVISFASVSVEIRITTSTPLTVA